VTVLKAATCTHEYPCTCEGTVRTPTALSGRGILSPNPSSGIKSILFTLWNSGQLEGFKEVRPREVLAVTATDPHHPHVVFI